MGCIYSSAEKESIERSQKIDAELRRYAKEAAAEIVFYLVGGTNSGKSTIFKQMRIIHGTGFSPEDCIQYKPLIYRSTIQSLNVILSAMSKHGIAFADSSSVEDARKFIAITQNTSEDELTSELVPLITRLWRDRSVYQCFLRSRGREYRLDDTAEYFLNQLDQIASSQYVPTVQDILRIRERDTKFKEIEFTLKGLQVRIFGEHPNGHLSRPFRQKFYRLIESVNAIIFCTDLSGYDLPLWADEGANCMIESLKLFELICNNKCFVETSVILFLNKIDLFKEKIRHTPINICFPEYQGPATFEDSAAYIQEKFENLNKNNDKQMVYTHLTCAIDSNNVQFVFDTVTDVVINFHLKDAVLL